jgi:excisionase family DNA binding protein
MALKDEYFTIAEAAKEIRVTRQTISRWVRDGVILTEKVGRTVLIRKQELYDYNEKRLLEEKRSSIQEQLSSLIREAMDYADDIKIEFTGIDFTGPNFEDLSPYFGQHISNPSEKPSFDFKTIEMVWGFLVTLPDGKQERIWVQLGKPETLVRGKDDPFVYIGSKIPIGKIGRVIPREQ